MQSLTTIRGLLAERGIRPKHRLGQNFLHDQNQLRKLVAAAQVQPGELVLEVGPGTGTLTETLLDAGAVVVACELDADMADIVEERLRDALGGRLSIVRGDCLDGKRTLNPALVAALGGRPFKLVANLPYQAATPLMAVLLTDYSECTGQFVTIQREVADRLLARPSTKAFGPLSVMVQLLAEVELIGVLSPGCFWPQPEVTSAMVAIRPRPDRPAVLASANAFGPFLARLFAARRKQLGTTLGKAIPWPAGIVPTMRPEQVAPEGLLALFQVVEGRAE